MALVQVSTYVTPAFKQQWESYVHRHQLTAAAVLRLMMQRVVGGSGEAPETSRTVRASTRPHLRLREHEDAALRRTAIRLGLSRQAYIVALIRANALNAATPTREELEALRNSNRQLAAVGRNLNQLVHAVNANDGRGVTSAERVLPHLCEALRLQHQSTVALVRSTLQRWTSREGVPDDDG